MAAEDQSVVGTNTGADSKAIRNDRLDALAGAVRDLVASNALTWPDFSQALRHHLVLNDGQVRTRDVPGIWGEAERVIERGEGPSNRRHFGLLIRQVESLLDVEVAKDAMTAVVSWQARLWRYFTNAIAFLLFVAVTYLVIGCLITGKSSFVQSPVWSLALFVLLLSLLAAVEALHISVTQLRLKDLHGSRSKYPRTFRMHRTFRFEDGMQRFLAGRQFIVIVTVFFIAQLTSFPHVTFWPGTSQPIPSWLAPVLGSVFLKLGLAGALMVLWIGQLAPQFMTIRRPQSFMNRRAIEVLFRMALVVEELGLTRPGDWIARWVTSEESIPISPQERYRQAVNEIEGIGTIGIRKAWSFGSGTANIEYSSAAIITKPGITKLFDSSLLLHLKRTKNYGWTGRSEATRGSSAGLVPDGTDEQYIGDWRRYREALVPKLGTSFHPGEVIVCEASISGSDAGHDGFLVIAPTKFLLFRLEIPDGIRRASAHATVYRSTSVEGTSDQDGDSTPIESQDLLPIAIGNGTLQFEYTVFYPDVGTFHLLEWNLSR